MGRVHVALRQGGCSDDWIYFSSCFLPLCSIARGVRRRWDLSGVRIGSCYFSTLCGGTTPLRELVSFIISILTR